MPVDKGLARVSWTGAGVGVLLPLVTCAGGFCGGARVVVLCSELPPFAAGELYDIGA